MAILKADRVCEINGVTVKEYFLTEHNPNKISMPGVRFKNLVGVTIHNTDTIRVSGTTMSEQYTRATVNGNMNSVRVHFYIDDTEAWQNLPLNYQSWHAGHSGRKDAHGSEIGNAQTISIECIMNGTSGEINVRAEDNAAKIAAYILKSNGLNINNLYTHNYWENIRNGRTGSTDYLNKANDGYKNCPIYIRPHWDNFVKKVIGYMGTGANENEIRVRVLDDSLNIREYPGTNSRIVGTITDKGIYTITETADVNGVTWGKLKSGIGWISLNPKYAVMK